MSIREQVLADMKAAMKSKDSARLEAVRFLQSAIKNKEIEVRPNEMTDDDALSVVKKLAKQLKDAIEQYEGAGRTELAEKEKAQLAVVEGYLPAQLSREEIEKVVAEVIAETGASTMKDMGNVIKGTIAKTKGAADNKTISEIARAKLN
jgi:uncharacterized protein YqeY